MQWSRACRRAEIERLPWEDVNLARGFVTVGAQNAKTGKRTRNVVAFAA